MLRVARHEDGIITGGITSEMINLQNVNSYIDKVHLFNFTDDTFAVNENYFNSSKYDYVVYMRSLLDIDDIGDLASGIHSDSYHILIPNNVFYGNEARCKLWNNL